VSPIGAICLGLVAGALCALAVGLKYRLGFDDSLDVVAVHLVAGIAGTLALGFIALPVDGEGGGLLYGGGGAQLLAQIVSVLVAMTLSAVMTALIGLGIHRTIGFRITSDDEVAGVDLSEHAETAYEFGGLGVGGSFHPFADQFRDRTPSQQTESVNS
jgi:Amt family ammonium transporter